MKKRAGSLWLALLLLTGSVPVQAAELELDDPVVVQQESAEQTEQETDSFELTDPVEEVPEAEQEITIEEAAEEPAVDGGAVDEESAEAVASAQQMAVDEDPQAYRATHRETAPEEQVQADMQRVMTLANTSITSIYTGRTYLVPSGKKITNGIDVSVWDGTINWKKVKAAGTDYAIVRCGYTGYGSGGLYPDSQYVANMSGAASAGVPVGVYIYSQATTKAEARAEAQYCLSKVKGYTIKMPIVMDVEFAEDSSGFTGRLYKANLSKSKQTEICKEFCTVIREAGYTPMIYANASMLRDNMNADELSAICPIWMANYTTATSYSGEYEYWQYSETGRVDGISTMIDCNFRLVDASGSGNTTPSATVPATSVSVSKETAALTYGSTLKLSATAEPSDTTDSVSWSSADTGIATVSSNGTVTATGVGKTTIKAKAGSKSASCTVTVSPEKVQITELRNTSYGNLKITWKAAGGAQTYKVFRSTTGVSGSYDKIGSTTGTSYKDTTVKPGVKYYYRVRASKSVGGTTYSGSYSAAKSATANIVTTALSLNSSSAKLVAGKTKTLKATIAPANSVSDVTWSSSDKSVATVSKSGKITAKKPGKAVITAKSAAKSVTCTVTVVPAKTTIKSAAKTGKGKIQIKWKSAKGAQKYYIYRSTSGKSGTFKRVKTSTKNSWTNKGLTSGKRYYYRITSVAVNGGTTYKGTVSSTVSRTA